MLNRTLKRNNEKTKPEIRGSQFLTDSSTCNQSRYKLTSTSGSLTGHLSSSGDGKLPESTIRYDSDVDCFDDCNEGSDSAKSPYHKIQEFENDFPDFLDADLTDFELRSFNTLGKNSLKQLSAQQIRQKRNKFNLQDDAIKSDFKVQSTVFGGSYLKTSSASASVDSAYRDPALGMGHTSSKRSRQDHTHHEIVSIGAAKSGHGQKRYLDDPAGREEFSKTALQVSPSSKSNYRRNNGLTGRSSPPELGNGTEMESEDQSRSPSMGWPQKKSGSNHQQVDSRSSKETASVSRSINAQPRFLHASAIKLHKLQFGIDKRLTIIDEKSNAVLKYRTPHFRALASVEIPPLPAGVNIQVGWIQVCTDMQFINTYGSEGLTSWEFPEIVSGKYKMVSDADGKQYPWYGSKNEVTHLQGPTQSATFTTVHMNDNFFPQVTWYIPSIGYTRDPSLTFVYRKQRFYTFLALKDVNTDTYQIIRTLTWSMELAIDVNPKNPLGKRAKLLGPFEQESPRVVPEHLTPPLKSYALNPPNANSCQVLVWRPRYGDTELVVPPVQTTMDMSRYLVSTRDATAKLLRITKSNFLLRTQEMRK